MEDFATSLLGAIRFGTTGLMKSLQDVVTECLGLIVKMGQGCRPHFVYHIVQIPSNSVHVCLPSAIRKERTKKPKLGAQSLPIGEAGIGEDMVDLICEIRFQKLVIDVAGPSHMFTGRLRQRTEEVALGGKGPPRIQVCRSKAGRRTPWHFELRLGLGIVEQVGVPSIMPIPRAEGSHNLDGRTLNIGLL